MIIVAFSTQTSKFIPKILCHKFKHAAMIVPSAGTQADNDMIIYQFVRRGHVMEIPIRHRDLRILRAHGWRFVYLATNAHGADAAAGAATCVGYIKRRLGIRDILIQTPLQLYKYLN